MGALGLSPIMLPSPEASRIEAMRDLWKAAGFDQIETREIVVQRSFADFEEYWTIAVTGAARLSADLATMAPANVERIKNTGPDAPYSRYFREDHMQCARQRGKGAPAEIASKMMSKKRAEANGQ